MSHVGVLPAQPCCGMRVAPIRCVRPLRPLTLALILIAVAGCRRAATDGAVAASTTTQAVDPSAQASPPPNTAKPVRDAGPIRCGIEMHRTALHVADDVVLDVSTL